MVIFLPIPTPDQYNPRARGLALGQAPRGGVVETHARAYCRGDDGEQPARAAPARLDRVLLAPALPWAGRAQVAVERTLPADELAGAVIYMKSHVAKITPSVDRKRRKESN